MFQLNWCQIFGLNYIRFELNIKERIGTDEMVEAMEAMEGILEI